MTTPLERLTCTHCGSPVPLSSEAETPCPACQTKVVVPERHREARRATEQVLANEVAARRWLERAGHEPPVILKVFTFLDGGLFWGLVFPAIFLPMGICLSTTLVPAFIRSVAHVRVVDVWADTTQGALSGRAPVRGARARVAHQRLREKARAGAGRTAGRVVLR